MAPTTITGYSTSAADPALRPLRLTAKIGRRRSRAPEASEKAAKPSAAEVAWA
jgi:hypothetical protein